MGKSNCIIDCPNTLFICSHEDWPEEKEYEAILLKMLQNIDQPIHLTASGIFCLFFFFPPVLQFSIQDNMFCPSLKIKLLTGLGYTIQCYTLACIISSCSLIQLKKSLFQCKWYQSTKSLHWNYLKLPTFQRHSRVMSDGISGDKCDQLLDQAVSLNMKLII